MMINAVVCSVLAVLLPIIAWRMPICWWGRKDSGKTQTALSLAQLVNCESETHKALRGMCGLAGRSLQAIILMCMC